MRGFDHLLNLIILSFTQYCLSGIFSVGFKSHIICVKEYVKSNLHDSSERQLVLLHCAILAKIMSGEDSTTIDDNLSPPLV